MDLMQNFNEKYLKAEPPKVEVGDTVRVHIKVKEGNRERIQVFEGTVIAKKHGGIEETFTVSPTALAWRRSSPSTLPSLRRSRPSVPVRCAGPSSTTCVTAWARAPRSRRSCKKILTEKERFAAPFLYPFSKR